MKKIILFSTLLIVCLSAMANDSFRKDKKAITDFIRQEYHSWNITQNEGLPSEHAFQTQLNSNDPTPEAAIFHAQNAKKNNTNLKSISIPNHKFSDFEFTIVHNQAIVQFTVDRQLVSAFLEKIDGNWKLVCAAHLDQNI